MSSAFSGWAFLYRSMNCPAISVDARISSFFPFGRMQMMSDDRPSVQWHLVPLLVIQVPLHSSLCSSTVTMCIVLSPVCV